MEDEVMDLKRARAPFSRLEKIFIFSLVGLASLFITAFFVLRYIVLNVSFAP
jgi:cell division protein FtsL